MNIEVNWSGEYACLCSGEWTIIIDGVKLTGLGSDTFDTKGEYESWHFDEDYQEYWETYSSGIPFSEWKKDPPNNLLGSLEHHGIEPTKELLHHLYEAIQEHDWRHGSCGGCI